MSLWKYLRGLKRPADWNAFVDLVSKTIVAAAGTAIAWGLAMYARHDERIVTQRADRREVVDMFLTFMPTDMDDPLFAMKLSTLSAYCNAEAAVQVASGRVALLEDDVLRILCEHVGQVADAARRRNSLPKVELIATPVPNA